MLLLFEAYLNAFFKFEISRRWLIYFTKQIFMKETKFLRVPSATYVIFTGLEKRSELFWAFYCVRR